MTETPAAPSPLAEPQARIELLQRLKAAGYSFVTPSIATHRRVLSRDGPRMARDLRDIFGWSLPFEPEFLEPRILQALQQAGGLRAEHGVLRSALRVASLGNDLFLHSAFPPNHADAIFFGPDSYRFVNYLADELRDAPAGGVLVDVGAGSAVGAVASAHLVRPDRIIVADLNPKALELAAANLAAAGLRAELVHCDGLAGVGEGLDLVVANPPFIAGGGDRMYRDGGDLHGARVSLNWAIAAAGKLAPGGRLLLYTGSAIVAGQDLFREALERELRSQGYTLDYREIDPDIFGAQLSAPGYGDVERIAAVGVRITRLA